MLPAHPDGFHGIYPATLCPFTGDGAVDETALARHVSGLAEVDGIVGVLCNGHAGENFLLTNRETRRVAETVSRAIGGRSIRRLGGQPRGKPGGGGPRARGGGGRRPTRSWCSRRTPGRAARTRASP